MKPRNCTGDCVAAHGSASPGIHPYGRQPGLQAYLFPINQVREGFVPAGRPAWDDCPGGLTAPVVGLDLIHQLARHPRPHFIRIMANWNGILIVGGHQLGGRNFTPGIQLLRGKSDIGKFSIIVR